MYCLRLPAFYSRKLWTCKTFRDLTSLYHLELTSIFLCSMAASLWTEEVVTTIHCPATGAGYSRRKTYVLASVDVSVRHLEARCPRLPRSRKLNSFKYSAYDHVVRRKTRVTLTYPQPFGPLHGLCNVDVRVRLGLFGISGGRDHFCLTISLLSPSFHIFLTFIRLRRCIIVEHWQRC
jgi:hypothetical protein